MTTATSAIGIANSRKDFLHNAIRTISQNHALVCIEDLQVRNMSGSCKCNSEQRAKKVAQKSGLNRSILDQGWGEFRRKLDYKLLWNGGKLLTVPPHHTSEMCPACVHENHADVVSAINILERGCRFLACGESVQSDRSMRQEAIKATGKSSQSTV